MYTNKQNKEVSQKLSRLAFGGIVCHIGINYPKSMFIYNISPIVYILFFALVTGSSCNGQVPKNQPAQPKQIGGKPKLIKTQGAGKFDVQYETVCCSLQDNAGNLWFGTTREGVYKYDGKLFTQYTVKDGLSSNGISSMLQDKNGSIWFGSREGLTHYNGKSFTRIPVTLNLGFQSGPTTTINQNNLLEKNEIWSMMQDKSGLLWLGTTDGIYCYDGKNFTRFLDKANIVNTNRLNLKWTQCMAEDKNGNIWFGSYVLAGEGISCYNGKTITNYKPLGAIWIRSIVEDKNGNLLFVTRNRGVCFFDGKDFINITGKGGPENSSINTLMEDKAGNLWFTTENGSGQLGEDGGLWLFKGNCLDLIEVNKMDSAQVRKKFTKFTTADGLIHNGVYCLVEDNTGNIWIGTRNTGLSRYDGKTFLHYAE